MFHLTVVRVLLFAFMDVQIEVKSRFYMLETETKNGGNAYRDGYESPSPPTSSGYGYASPPSPSSESTPSGFESDLSAQGCESTSPASDIDGCEPSAPSSESTPSGCESDPSAPDCESTPPASGIGSCEEPSTVGCESVPRTPCTESTPRCGSTSPPGEGEPTSPAQGDCFLINMNYWGGETINRATLAKDSRCSAAECQALCVTRNGCNFFTWEPDYCDEMKFDRCDRCKTEGLCWLKSSVTTKNPKFGSISGPKSCNDPLPDLPIISTSFQKSKLHGSHGRPFIVQGRSRTSSSQICSSGNLKHAESWKMGEAPSVLSSNPHNQEIGRYWLKQAEAEHASVASFARHTLQLMSIGAPSRLLVASQEASVDEIKHAKMCYVFASAFIGSDVGPGSLDVHGSLQSMDFNGIIKTIIIEGCIDETLSAIEAHFAAYNAQDSAVKAAVSQIATDETKHAQLAWDTIKWIIEKYPDSSTHTEEIFHIELEQRMMSVRNDSSLLPATVCEDAKDTTFRRYGLLVSGDREKVREVGIRNIIEPIYRAGFKDVNMISKQIKELDVATLVREAGIQHII